MIKAVLFDWGGVLIKSTFTDSVALLIKKKTGTDIRGDEYKKYTRKMDRAEISFSDFIGHINEHFKLSFSIAEWKKIFKDSIVDNDDVIKVVKKLKCDYRLAILSNNSRAVVEILEKHHRHVLDLFEKKYFSFEQGMHKPNEDIFMHALNDMKVKPNECVFIDDQEKNYIAAENLGINTIQFVNSAQLKEDLGKILGKAYK